MYGWADTLQFKVKGNTALATFQSADPQDPCIENFVTVVASDLMEKTLPGSGGKITTVRTVLIVGQRDICLSLTLLTCEGETSDQAFRLADDLSSAALSTTVPVLDLVSHDFVNFEVNLTWTAQGQPVFEQTKETFQDKDLGILIVSQTRGTHVEAEATGTVVGLGQNFTPEPSESAALEKVNDGTIVIQKTK